QFSRLVGFCQSETQPPSLQFAATSVTNLNCVLLRPSKLRTRYRLALFVGYTCPNEDATKSGNCFSTTSRKTGGWSEFALLWQAKVRTAPHCAPRGANVN